MERNELHLEKHFYTHFDSKAMKSASDELNGDLIYQKHRHGKGEIFDYRAAQNTHPISKARMQSHAENIAISC